MIALPLKLTPYTRRYRRPILDLVNDGRCRLHVHLDWHRIEDWIDQPDTPIVLAWHEHRLIGVLAGSPPLGNASWLRLVAVDEDTDPDIVLLELWSALKAQLRALGVEHLGVLMLQSWLGAHLGGLGFEYREHIVTLRREGLDVPAPLLTDVDIRHADIRHVPQAVLVDHAAFEPMWRLSAASLRQAVRNASSFTLAELDGRMIGYQITTLHVRSAHLSRLAVHPAYQGIGVGGALLSEVILSFLRRGAWSFTVNTQSSNEQSQRLYWRYGFTPTGHDMPYWSVDLAP